MALLTVDSSNPKLSFVLYKNPASGMQVDTLRFGYTYGWYENDQKYHLMFQEGPRSFSFPHDNETEAESIEPNALCSPLAYLSMIGTYFDHVTKKEIPEDTEGFKHSITFQTLYTPRAGYLETFAKQFKGFELSITPLNGFVGNVTVSTDGKLKDLFAFGLCVLIACANKIGVYFPSDENQVLKYIRLLNMLKAPYLAKYMLKCSFIRSKDVFQKVLPELNKSENNISFTYGSNLDHRKSEIRKILKVAEEPNMIEFGFGESCNYVTMIAAKKFENYFAVDISKDAREVMHYRMKKAKGIDVKILKSWDNLKKFARFEEFEDKSFILLATEVIEHMPYEEAVAFLKDVAQNKKIGRVIITVPNRDFNKYYREGEYVRDEDHKWEPTFEELSKLMSEIFTDRTVLSMNLGDSVNGVATSSMCVAHPGYLEVTPA